MMNRTAKLLLTSSALFLAFFVGRPDTAQADTATSNVHVTATIAKVCTIKNSAISFGIYDPLSGAVLDASGDLKYTCTSGVPITVDLGTGGNPSGALRGMSNTISTLTYQIYSEETHTTVWGAGSGTGGVDATGSGIEATLTMYGRIQASQTGASPGSYVDDVQATLNF
jgi:spore coat protein U-like protein